MPRSLHVEPGHGYDGQFFYRLALAPADLGLEAQGVRLDTALRRQRPGYPALAWLLSGGRPALVAWALLVVNVLGLVGLLGGLAAQDAGRHALTLGELHVTGALVLLGDPRRRLALPAVVLSAGWLTTAAFRALVVRRSRACRSFRGGRHGRPGRGR